MLLLYTIGIKLYYIIIWLIAPFNQKAKLFIKGRRNIFDQIARRINPNEKHIWFHFASLGEFEQGRTVLEKLKSIYPEKKIAVTFFSPSGYEIRKNYDQADGIFYLPVDSSYNAKKFIKSINPEMAIFTKYEFWYYYFTELQKNNIPLYLISGIFRANQVFFKRYGDFYRRLLHKVTYFFVQNEESVKLLNAIDIHAVSLSGDTRFDRVYENAKNPKRNSIIETFCGDANVFIAGSTWPEDEKLLVKLTDKYPDWKFIIAPHEIHERHIKNIENEFGAGCIRFSALDNKATAPQISNLRPQILVIDNIGMLSALYQYGKLTYIGGGFGAGIHNTLEAVAFGLPVIFGPKYDKFQEAKDLIKLDIARSISNGNELLEAFEYFNNHKTASKNAKEYIDKKKGATEIIVRKISF